MPTKIDLEVAELLASRLCHDLVGPLGAVSNGLELMAEDEPAMIGESLELVQKSALQGTDILQFYRLAYGMAGAQAGDDPNLLVKLISGYLMHRKAELAWADPALPDWFPEGGGKLIMNMVALAVEMLPRGGRIALDFEDDGRLLVGLTGQGAGPRDGDTEAALAGQLGLEELTPRNVHGHFTNLIALRLGGQIGLVRNGTDDLALVFTR